MRFIDLNNKLKILGTHFSYNEKSKEEKKAVTDTQQVFKIWKTRNLTLEGKIVIFKTILISKNCFSIIYNDYSKT